MEFFKKKLFLFFLSFLFLLSCNVTENQVRKVLEKNPEIFFEAIEKNPSQFFETIKTASIEARKKQKEEDLQRQLKNPKKPMIKEGKAYFGNKEAPVTIVEYSDFLCPYCAQAATLMDQIMDEYGEKIKVVYKHFPVKAMALPTAKYYEALAIEGAKKKDYSKVKAFHDEVFKNQRKLFQEKEKYLKKVAKKIAGASFAKIEKLKDSSKVKSRIDEDMDEANRFGVRGTPNFIVGGVSIPGLIPFEEMKKYVDMALKAAEEKK